MNEQARPDGIEHRHVHEAQGSILRRRPFGLAALTLVLLPAFFGVYGSKAIVVGTGPEVRLTVEGPSRIRNGEYLEIILNIEAQSQVEEAVVLVGASLLRDITVNTLLPTPSEQGFRDDSFEFRFGRLDASDRLNVKIDAQINTNHTPSASEGAIAVADGETMLTKVDYAIEVLP
ncbi:MAG TPA: hypothetical protein VKZ91_00525 [Woeseiaceae bacterium]|nr:hypothetical protein [Woeseiaceae bacterium]